MGGDFFVGRAGEVARLEGLLAGVAAGVGGAVLVEGEQGIGKTALLRQALGGAGGAGCALAWAAADELGRRFPLWLMMECLGARGQLAAGGGGRPGEDGPGAGPVPPGDPVAAGVERLLAWVDRWCAVSPVVVVAEDLQWADEASLLVWRRLARVVGQVPLLLAGSLRPGSSGGELDRLRRELVSGGGTVMSLGPLAPRELSELAGRLAGGRPGRRLAGVVRRAGGNPLYARELVDALARDGRVRVEAGVAELAGPSGAVVPASLAAAIGGRLSALPQEAAGVLRWAAVLGQEFTVTDLAVVADRTAGQLAGVVAAAVAAGVVGAAASDAGAAGEGVVAGAGPRLGFRHGLIRQVLYDGMPEALRAALHLQAARALASAGAAPERVAAQLAVVPEPADGWVLGWLADAAPGLTYRAPKVAAELLRGALSRMPDDDERREALEAALVTVAFRLVRNEEVERVARPLLARTADPDRAAEVAWLLGYTLGLMGRPAGMRVVEEALERPGTSEVWKARLQAMLAFAMAMTGQPDTAQAAGKALAVAEGAADRFAAGYALHVLCMVDFVYRRHAAALDHIEQALEVIGDDPQTTDLRLLLLSFRVLALENLDRHAEAGTVIRETLPLAERAGTPRMATICNVAAEHYFGQGLWDDTVAVLEQATPLPGPFYSPMHAHGLMALIAGHRDDRQTAAEHLEAVRDQETGSIVDRSIFDRSMSHFPLLAQALAAEQAGQPGQAVAVLSVSLDRAVARHLTYRYLFFPVLVRLALATGDAATAAAAVQAAEREAEREALPVKAAAAAACRGLLDGDPGPLLAAAGYYESAGRPLERAQALEEAAVLLAGRGDLQQARQAFGDAIGLYRDLGAQWDIRRAASRVHRHGIRPGVRGRRQAHPAAGWGALTPTETKIAYLISRGQSNPDIAAELWLSRHTVQTHVSHILAKLSARSREEIVREALKHPAAREQAARE